MKTRQLIQLSSRLNGALNQFALAANATGEYPWQQQQREKRNRRVGGGIVAAGVLGGAGYAGHRSVMQRGAAAGPVRAGDAYKAVGNEALDKVKTAGAAGAARAATYGKNVKGAYQGARAGTAGLGWKKPGMGVGKAALAALKGVRFGAAQRLVELEAQLDDVLVEFGSTMKHLVGDDERKKKAARIGAGAIAVGGGAFVGDHAIMSAAKKKYGFTPTRANAYGDAVTSGMQAGKRGLKKGMAQASYHAEPALRKIKDALGLRKVAGRLK
jgi:hypothetical protein